MFRNDFLVCRKSSLCAARISGWKMKIVHYLKSSVNFRRHQESEISYSYLKYNSKVANLSVAVVDGDSSVSPLLSFVKNYYFDSD